MTLVSFKPITARENTCHPIKMLRKSEYFTDLCKLLYNHCQKSVRAAPTATHEIVEIWMLKKSSLSGALFSWPDLKSKGARYEFLNFDDDNTELK